MRKLFVIACLTLAGCASRPTILDKPGATRADLNRDTAQCQYEIQSRQAPQRFYDGGIGGSMQQLGDSMREAGNTYQLLELCMVAKGWSVVSR